jgi:methylated-DNA-protein-cysteine methyltransferase-like protein
VPWHRVVTADGRIALRDGAGMREQRRRLEAEGVSIDPRGRVTIRPIRAGRR